MTDEEAVYLFSPDMNEQVRSEFDCPKCGKEAYYANIGRSHWFYCPHGCKVTWYVGDNLFSGWLYETEEVWQGNKAMLADFENVTVWPDDLRVGWRVGKVMSIESEAALYRASALWL